MKPETTRIVRVEADGTPAWGLVDGEVVLHLPDGPFASTTSRGASLGALDDLGHEQVRKTGRERPAR